MRDFFCRKARAVVCLDSKTFMISFALIVLRLLLLREEGEGDAWAADDVELQIVLSVLSILSHLFFKGR